MTNSIAKIHQEVFDLLISHHKKDSQILFTLRKINRSSRLDKGYWFLGNDDYLTVSFWKGRDWVTRMPSISFTILVSGETYLELNDSSISSKMDFFNESFLKRIWTSPEDVGYGFKKRYSQYNNEEYLKSLEFFLNNDKKVIDEALEKGDVFWPEAMQYTELIEPLWIGDFNKDLKRTQKYQRKLQNKRRQTGYLKYISVDHFGPINKLDIPEIPNGCRWIFLTGENGAGKTSLLKSIATGLTNNIDDGEQIWIDDKPYTIKLGIDGPNGIEHYAVDESMRSPERKWLPKGLAMYGPVRLFTQESQKLGIFKTENTDIHKASYGLFHSMGLLKDLSEPLKLTGKPKYHELDVESFTYSITENLKHILPNVFQILVEEEDGKLQLNYFQAKPSIENNNIVQGVKFENLPSGSRSIAAIIIDLIIRFREQQPAVNDLAEYSGIVLIDEIDLHLHPKMQKELVIQLSETFPNIQFIVTTHSPIPLLGAPKNSMFITVCRDEHYKIFANLLNIDITNMLPNTILSSPIFDFNTMASINHQEKDRFITEDDYDEAIFYRILANKIKNRELGQYKDDSPSA